MNLAIPTPPCVTLRATLVASFRAARRCVNSHSEIVLNDASHAGMLLAVTGDARAAIALETGQDDHAVRVRTHLRAVYLEELAEARSGASAREERRRLPTLSDEEPESR